MTTYIVLLRAVNVGGHSKLPMAALREALTNAGYEGVRTYIQSGNIVLESKLRSGAKLEQELAQVISDYAGFDVPVLVRSRSEWEAVIEANPYPGTEGTKLHVVFLPEVPAADLLGDLDIDLASFEPEHMTLVGRELYLFLPDGIGRSKLAVALNRQKGAKPGTARNWRTVEKLLALADEDADGHGA